MTKPPETAEKKSGKRKFLTIGALVTSTPFLIAIALHALLLIGGGSVVVFQGGNPLAIFTSQQVGEGDGGSEVEAPPSPEEPTPEPDAQPMANELEPMPTDLDQGSDVLALSTPSAVPSFAPPAPAKVSAPSSTAAPSAVKIAAAPRPVGKAGAKRTKGSTLFGFTEKVGGELEGTMYDFKLKADGKTPSKITEKGFIDAVRKVVRNRFRPSSLNEYYRVDKKFYATTFFIPLGTANEAPKAFGVQGKVKPNYFLIHYTGSFAAPEDGTYRFVGLGDDSIVVMVDGTTRLEGNWVPFISFAERNDKQTDLVQDFFPVDQNSVQEKEQWARLRQGEWIPMKAGQSRRLDVILIESGDAKKENGGNFAFALLIEKQGAKYEEKKKGKNSLTILPPFMLEEPDSGMLKIMRENKDKLEVDLKNAPLFGTSSPVTEPEPSSAPPPLPGGRTDTATAYGSEWKDASGAVDGWEAWILRANGNPDKKSYAGFYLAKQEEKSGSEPVATEGRSFAIFADGEGFQEAAAFRGLAKPLESNQSFSIDMIAPAPKSNSGSTGSMGLTLRNGKKSDEPKDYNAGARFELAALEGQANYQVFDGSQPSDSGLAVTPAGLRVEFTLKSADTYDVRLSPLGGGSPVELKDRKLGGTAGSPIESLSIFNRDSEQNTFFNRLRLNP